VIHRLPLGPGSQLPAWLEDLDAACFGRTWGPLDEGELLWVEPGLGFARWSTCPPIGEAELLRLAVVPSARRTGLGRRLLETSVRELAGGGMDVLRLEVRASNAAARALYESGGWVPDGLRRAYYRDGEDAVLYSRRTPEGE
jgi:[ribosomal protein S18]-alanine N-acetyltransferase